MCRSRPSSGVDAVAQWVRAIRSSPVHAAVFGSFARGDGGVHSDIHVCLIVDDDLVDDEARLAQVQALGQEVLAWRGNRAKVPLLGTQAFAQASCADESIVDALLDESNALLAARPLTDLLH